MATTEKQSSTHQLNCSNLYQYMTPHHVPNNRPDLSSNPSVIITALVDRTTAHGFRSHRLSRGLVKKGFWLAVMLAMTGALLYNLVNLTNKLLANGVDVSLTVSSNTQLTFPAVTVCNMSPVKRSSLAASEAQSESKRYSSASGKRRKRRQTSGLLYEEIGCFADSEPRDLPEEASASLPSVCVEVCYSRGFTYAGLQDGGKCFCGNSYGSYGASDQCNVPCSEDSSQICGGLWANTVMLVIRDGGYGLGYY